MRFPILTAAALLAVTSLSALAANQFTISPALVQRGATTNLLINIGGCPAEGKDQLGKNSLDISGDGFTLATESARTTDCSLAIQAQISTTAAIGKHNVLVYDKDRKLRLASLEIEVGDLTAGPIPPGLSPQVDVLHNILSEDGCSDQFGVRISRHYYCVEVQLGNNTGYALLLAGVGFMRSVPGMSYKESNASYLQMRSVLQREQIVSGRNITMRALEAAGVVIAGFTPFSGNSGRRGRIGIWSSLVGNVIAGAYEGLIPDRTVRQLSNLDDAALRDGKLIPNNSPVKFTVFVDRESIAPLLADPECYRAYFRGELLREVERIRIDLELSRVKEIPTDLLEKEYSRLVRQAAVFHDKQPSAAKKAQIEACEAGKVSRTGRGVNLLGRSKPSRETDLLAVRKALGSLVIVGDPIEYRPRIRVDSNAVNPEIRPNPTINGIEGGAKAKQGDKVTIALIGNRLDQATVSAVKCADSPIRSSVDPGGGRLTLTDLTIPASCTDASVQLIIHTGASLPAVFDVPIEPMKPAITDVKAASTDVEEGKDQKLSVTVTGTGLAGGTPKVTLSADATKELAVTGVTAKPTEVAFTVEIPAASAKAGVALDVSVKTRHATAATKAKAITLTKKP